MQSKPLDEEDVENGVVERHITFLKRRKLCFMHMVDNEGGTLLLHPRGDLGLEPVELTVEKGRLLIFRCDLFSFEFNPKGEHVTLMAWVLDAPAKLETLDVIASRDDMYELAGHSVGPRLPDNSVRAHIMSYAMQTGGCVMDMPGAMSNYVSGCDGHFKVSNS